jgi:hypothetical protein
MTLVSPLIEVRPSTDNVTPPVKRRSPLAAGDDDDEDDDPGLGVVEGGGVGGVCGAASGG